MTLMLALPAVLYADTEQELEAGTAVTIPETGGQFRVVDASPCKETDTSFASRYEEIFRDWWSKGKVLKPGWQGTIKPDQYLAYTFWPSPNREMRFPNNLGDGDLIKLKGLPLKVVDVPLGEKTTDAGLEILGGLAELQFLKISQSKEVTARGINHLRGLKKLRYLDISHLRVNDETLASLKELRSLEMLDLSGTPLSGRGFTHLERLTALREIRLNGCEELSDEGVAALSMLPALRELSLRQSASLTAVGLAHLADCRRLTHLSLWQCGGMSDGVLKRLSELTELKLLVVTTHSATRDHVTDEGAKYLGKLTSLEKLRLFGWEKLTDEGLAHLKALEQITELFLDGSFEITDNGLAHLKALKKLERLRLWGCFRISDAGLAHLEELPNLRHLVYQPTAQTTQEGERRLKKALPNLKISTDWFG
ncbi:MAG: hypothetical protein HS108_13075 [Planctomycetes bacterium]|nr:hypothetical protein [Planctomycetota bacterium]MCL4730626.1 hypothetical protein [Planctomycetota bacterium]